jgi:flagellar hook-basal body complex protein FliE
MNPTDLAVLLGRAGAAVSPNDSWQQRLGATAADMASAEQDRKFLADLLGGMPDPSGRRGLDPNVVLHGMQLRHQIEQSRPEEIQLVPVETPWGDVEQVPAEEAPEYKRKIWAEQRDTVPTSIRTWREFQDMPEDEQQAFLEFSKSQRGKSFEETLAEFLVKQREAQKQRYKTEQELELGTPESVSEVMRDLEDSAVTNFRQSLIDQGRNISFDGARELLAITDEAKRIEDNIGKYSRVRYFTRGEKGPGFYGKTEDGEWEFFKSYTPRAAGRK